MRIVHRVLAVTVALALWGCGAPPPSPPAVRSTDPALEARRAVERRDWRAAAPLLRRAVFLNTKDLALHYDLAICASYLGLRDEAIREFQWVVANAPAGSPEVEAASSWLREAGILPSRIAANQEPGFNNVEGDSTVRGQVTWWSPRVKPKPGRSMQLHLIGVPQSHTKDQHYTVRTDEQGRFEFKDVLAGTYRLTNATAGDPIWRLKVDLAPKQRVEVNLNPDNSVKLRDDFPESSG